MRNKMFAIARVVKSHGKRGEVVCESAGDLPFLIKEGMSVTIVPPALKGPRDFHVNGVSADTTSGLVSFAEIDSISLAEKIVGKYILAHEADLPENFELEDPNFVIGLEVEDTKLGYLGSIVEVHSGPTQDVWEIEGKDRRYLVPIVDGVIEGLSQKQLICISAKPGSIMIEDIE